LPKARVGALARYPCAARFALRCACAAFNIDCAVRVAKNTGKTFRRFDTATNTLTIDVREIDEKYILLSKNEQRERLENLAIR
jgi:hypothetical protein